LQKTWKEIMAYIGEVSQPIYQTINPPATQQEIDELETALSVMFPDSFKDYLFSMNGQKSTDFPLLGYNCFLSTDDILKTWRMMNGLFENEKIDWRLEDKMKSVIWDKGWIPFTDWESTTRLVLDLAPGKNGSLGQIFQYPDSMDYQEIIANSFDEFTEEILKRLKMQRYSINSDTIEFADLYI
jgi:cell wall assembly regulator SMI1